MIDFIKVQLIDFDRRLLESNPLLDFYDVVNTDTGEIRTTNKDGKKRTPCKSASYQGLEFRIFDSGTILLKGSLHKYWNQGLHNYNDFYYSALRKVLLDIERTFSISPKQMKLRVVELGVNITPPYPTLKIINYLINHRRKQFEWVCLNGKGHYKQACHSQFYVKVYDKAKQYREKYNIIDDILRFEIKVIKMEKLKELNIKTLDDLVNIDFSILGDILVKEWESILFYDFTIQSNSKSLDKYMNPNYWMELVEEQRSSAYNKHFAKLKTITQEHSLHVQDKISSLIKEKCIELSMGVYSDQGSTLANGVQNDHLNIGAIDTPFNMRNNSFDDNIKLRIEKAKKNRRCLITGVDISMQKKDSFLVNNTALNYYHKNQREIFERLKYRYLPDRWTKAGLERQVNEIAHAIRSRSQVIQIKQKRLYPQNQLQLFSQPHIKNNKHDYKINK
jgi:hypothetical protein